MVVVAMLAGCLGTVALAQQQQDPKKRIKAPVQMRAQAQLKVPGIDPAVVGIQAEMVKKLSPSSVEVKIVGIVKNIGTENFVSSKEQQAIRMYEKAPGATDRVVATKKFVNLNVGQTIRIEHTLPWTGSVEFPADYQVRIDYDPDIFADDNDQNDDVRMTDNKRDLAGSTITAKVQKYLAAEGVTKKSPK
jgi:hypothetical protein